MLCSVQRAIQIIALATEHLYFLGGQLKQMAAVLRAKAYSIINAAAVLHYCPYQINLNLTHW